MSGVDPRTLNAGQHVQITPHPFTGTVVEVMDGRFTIDRQGPDLFGLLTSVASDHGSVEVLPDPLPTEMGTHIVATVTVDGQSARSVSARVNQEWRSALPLLGGGWFRDEQLSDWRVLDLPPEPGAQDRSYTVADMEADGDDA